jgi:hypothetical protein
LDAACVSCTVLTLETVLETAAPTRAELTRALIANSEENVERAIEAVAAVAGR